VINWLSLFFNGLWILGSAILLAAFSYQLWAAQEYAQPLPTLLNQLSFLRATWFGLALITTGFAGSSQHPWETALWSILTLLCLGSLLQSWEKVQNFLSKKQPKEKK